MQVKLRLGFVPCPTPENPCGWGLWIVCDGIPGALTNASVIWLLAWYVCSTVFLPGLTLTWMCSHWVSWLSKSMNKASSPQHLPNVKKKMFRNLISVAQMWWIDQWTESVVGNGGTEHTGAHTVQSKRGILEPWRNQKGRKEHQACSC